MSALAMGMPAGLNRVGSRLTISPARISVLSDSLFNQDNPDQSAAASASGLTLASPSSTERAFSSFIIGEGTVTDSSLPMIR